MPYHIDWKLVADTYRNGTPAWRAIALAMWVLPVPRLALEQDAAARFAAEPVLEGGVAEEQIQRLDDLVADLAEALDVVDADVDLLGPVQQVRRASLAEHGQQHDHGDQQDDQQRREPQHGLRAEAQAVRGGTLTAPGGLR